MMKIARVAPVFTVRKLEAAVTLYRSLGFDVSLYPGGGYAFAFRDSVELHLDQAERAGQHHRGRAYLFVDDADELAKEWSAHKTAGKITGPSDKPWGMREGEFEDPDGNVIVFGS